MLWSFKITLSDSTLFLHMHTLVDMHCLVTAYSGLTREVFRGCLGVDARVDEHVRLCHSTMTRT